MRILTDDLITNCVKFWVGQYGYRGVKFVPGKKAIDTVIEHALNEIMNHINEPPFISIKHIHGIDRKLNDEFRELYSRGEFSIKLLNIPYYSVRGA